MPTDMNLATSVLRYRWAAPFAALLLLAQLIVVGTVYKHGISFDCGQNWPDWACAGPSGALVSVYAILAAIGLFVILSPAPFRRLVEDAGWSFRPLLMNLAGFFAAMVPVMLLAEGQGTRMLFPTLALWTAGFGLMLLGLANFMAPWSHWRQLVSEQKWKLGLVVGAGLLAPPLSVLIRPIWQLEAIAGWTFGWVAWIVQTLGYQVDIFPERKVIGYGEFFIDIAPVCSGIEGIALVTVFVTLYLALFRQQLRFPLVLLLYPIGIMVSAMLNIVRIAVLLVIGLEGNPELAVGGFHSHAGWLMFTLIAVGIVAVAQSVPALQKGWPTQPSGETAPYAPPPFFQDPLVARILPFAVFMFSALLSQAFAANPGIVYPLRVLAMAAALLAFWQVIAALEWRVSIPAVAVGAAIGLMWVAVPYSVTDTTPAFANLSGAVLIGWMILRGVGTVMLVPIIEELFFRDYLENKLLPFAGAIVAAIITATLFALLHDRWAEAFIAGLAFSWLARRSGNITDAIVGHAVANVIVFGYALATQQMHII